MTVTVTVTTNLQSAAVTGQPVSISNCDRDLVMTAVMTML